VRLLHGSILETIARPINDSRMITQVQNSCQGVLEEFLKIIALGGIRDLQGAVLRTRI